MEAKLQISLLLQVDPNTGVAMYESDDIIKYLVGKYGIYGHIYLLPNGVFQFWLFSIDNQYVAH